MYRARKRFHIRGQIVTLRYLGFACSSAIERSTCRWFYRDSSNTDTVWLRLTFVQQPGSCCLMDGAVN
jgi:hypothetical protein